MERLFVLLALGLGVSAQNNIGDGLATMNKWCEGPTDAFCEDGVSVPVNGTEECEAIAEAAGDDYISSTNVECQSHATCDLDSPPAQSGWNIYYACTDYCLLSDPKTRCNNNGPYGNVDLGSRAECEALAAERIMPYYSWNPSVNRCLTTPTCETPDNPNSVWEVWGACDTSGGGDDPHFITPHGEMFDLKARDGDMVTVVEVPGSVIVDAGMKGQGSEVFMDTITVWANNQKVTLTLENFDHDVREMKSLFEGEATNVELHPAVLNQGRDCWVQCGKSGPCAFCGQGNCCRKNWFGGQNGCAVEDGGEAHHECSAPAKLPAFNPFATQGRVEVSPIEVVPDIYHEANRRSERPSVGLTFETFFLRVYHLESHFDLEFDALESGCHDNFGGLLGETFRCSEWHATEGKYKSMRSVTRRKTYKRARSITKDDM